jgi:ABC-type polysaccharide/polyol phosphate transport system ATPase subunit
MASEHELAIGVSRARKAFRAPKEAVHTLKETVLHPLRRRGMDEFTALDDVSFNVRRGEFFGIVGRNGSGKSTLLKCMAGIYGLDAGRIVVDGRMSTFIELGVGFNPDLAARDNVVMNGIMLGLTPREARARYERIIAFAELEEFQELKLKNYSSGMHVRLAFSVAIQVEADILLIDEVLAVGDAAFQQKCFDVFHQMRADGRTVLFVTHDMSSVARMCDRALLLEKGRVVMIDEPGAVANRYMELNFARAPEAELLEPGSHEHERAASRRVPVGITGAWIEGDGGEQVSTCIQGREYSFVFMLEFFSDVTEPAFTVIVLNEDRHDMLVATTAFEREGARDYAPGDHVRVCVTFDPLFRPSRYSCSLIVGHPGVGPTELTRLDRLLSFVISGPYATGGLTDLPHAISVQPADSCAAKSTPGR